MRVPAVRFSEPLAPEEYAFLRRREHSEWRMFYKGARVIMGICFLVPFAFAWVKALDGKSNPFSPAIYFAGVGFLLVLSGVAAYLSYHRTIRRLHRDIKGGEKLVEPTEVTRKLFMPHNSTYHVYLSSANQLSIEVSEVDYHLLRVGDEVNIEYTPNAKVYLGYY